MYLFASLIIAIALILDFSIGTIPLEIFRFPLNILILLGLIFCIYIISEDNKSNSLFKSISKIGSVQGAVFTSTLLIISTLLSIILPSYFLSTSWTFVSIILLFSTSLGILIKKQISSIILEIKSHKKWSHNYSVIIHIGIFITILSLVFGSSDSTTIYHDSIVNYPSSKCITDKGETETLPFLIVTDKVEIIQKNNIVSDYIASFHTIDKDTTIKYHESCPNHPAHYNGYDIYLSDIKTSDFSNNHQVSYIINKSPWKIVTYIGITLCLMGLIILFFKK